MRSSRVLWKQSTFALREQLQSAVDPNVKMSHDEYEDAKAADFAPNLQRLTMEQACVSAMSQELNDFKRGCG